jgi:rare lipoprotein A
MPTIVRVTNLDNGRSVVVRVNDRGPFVEDRLIDVSRAGARELGFEGRGLARVRVTVMREASLRLKQAAGIADRGSGDAAEAIIPVASRLSPN